MKPLQTAAAVVACLILMTACSRGEQAVAQTAAPTAKNGPAQNPYARVEIHTGAGQFWLQLRRCSVGPDADSGVMPYSIEGAGQSPEGEPICVTVAEREQ